MAEQQSEASSMDPTQGGQKLMAVTEDYVPRGVAFSRSTAQAPWLDKYDNGQSFLRFASELSSPESQEMYRQYADHSLGAESMLRFSDEILTEPRAARAFDELVASQAIAT